VLALKNRGCPEFTVLNVYFLLFKIFEQLALALKNRCALEFFTVLKYILLFRIFEELVVALKTEFALKFFKPGGAAAPPPRTPMLAGVAICAQCRVRIATCSETELTDVGNCFPTGFASCESNRWT